MSAAHALYSRDHFCHLPAGVSTLTLAEECRAAALGFVNGVAGGWGKRELGEWLSGVYRHVTQHAPVARSQDRRSLVYRDTSKNAPMLDNATLSTLLRDARWSILAALEGSAAPRTARGTYVGSTLAHHLAVPCIDAAGNHGWAPVDAPAARLHQRVLALFAVDQLRNPELHRTALLVCPRCERVVVDVDSKVRGLCREHPETQEVSTPRSERPAPERVTSVTRPYVVASPERPSASSTPTPLAKRTLIGVGRVTGTR